ncbi:EamA family transporter [Fischerella major NIES-592]|uniref:EamA family transporter n=2 Tax=Fischerella TaxID=1190 RepID=A0A1U7H2R5_9CYAN|nr:MULTISPECIES: DMT family transporter [Fischerella]OKH15391.1 EamA family transporter [Fischerella major NIES-592]PMB40543.1 EamA family transporter [Fischerella thermalis CCMEE 5330]
MGFPYHLCLLPFAFFMSFQGEIAALSAACLWAIASVVYGRLGERIPPLQLNLMKGIVAIALLLLTIVLSSELFPSIAPIPLSLILLSGVVGIGFGDTVFFASINSLGARRALLMGTLAPPMTAIGAMIFLQEQLNLSAWCGILLTILGVAWVVTERTPEGRGTRGEGRQGGQGGLSSRATTNLWRGIGFGVLAAIANAVGALFSRAAFAQSVMNPLWAALLRLSAGVLILLIFTFSKSILKSLLYRQSLRRQVLESPSENLFSIAEARQSRVLAAIIFAAFCGTYLGIWLQQIALKFTVAGVASTLLQTSPVFIIPIGMWLGEKVTWRAIAGVIIAIAGVGLLFYLK